MFEVREKPNMVGRALLLGVYFHKQEEPEARDLLEELTELVKTLGIGIVQSVLVKSVELHVRTLMGSGKAKEMIDLAKSLDCDCIVFDNELSPAQQRAWETDSGICVIDRQEVILDIFNERARTKEARLQVELARMEYSLPRLARMWAHLDRQAGGVVGGRGEGETQLEIDRRLARKRIDSLRAQLAEVRQQRGTQRKERLRVPLPHASIVGYTNAGKSSLLNRLTGSDVLAEDKLFATLDPTTRRIDLPNGQALLLTDTVGFIRRLPHRLVEAFRATLEEAILADFLIHVLDASDPRVSIAHQTTNDVLAELGAEGKPTLLVLNKIDLVDDAARRRELESRFPGACLISAQTGEGEEHLIDRLCDMVVDRMSRVWLRVPQSNSGAIARIHREGKVIDCVYEGNDALLHAMLPASLRAQMDAFETEAPSLGPG